MGLGLNMKILNNLDVKITRKRIFLSLIALGIATAASCLKKTDLQVDDLGSALEAQDIANALDNAFGPIDYNEIKSNEMTDIVVSQSLQAGTPQNLEDQFITIKSINNIDAYLEIQSHAVMTSFSSSGNVVDERDWDQYFPKYNGFAFSPPAQKLTTTSTNQNMTAQQAALATKTATVSQGISQMASGDLQGPIFTFQLVQSLALASCQDSGSYPETCYNLSVTDIDWQVPPASASQHNCGDLYNCFIKAKRVEFDMLQNYNLDSEGKPRRVHYSLVISQAVPFTSRVLEYCTRALYQLSGVDQKVMADICYKVNRYSFGTP
jgi:hypothetical protein